MGVLAGRVAVDDGESMGTSVRKSGKVLGDDEDLWDCGDKGGGGLLEKDLPEYQQAIGKIRIIEQVRQNLAHQRHSRLHARQEDSSLYSVSSNGPIGSSTPIVSTDSSTLSIVLPSGLAVSSASVQTDIISDVPIGTTPQTLLSSTPPPSPAETSVGMTIPPITSTSSALTITTQPPSQSTGSTNTHPYTTVTSYWTSQTLRNNGTALSNARVTSSSFSSTASTVTLDGTVVVFTYPTNISSNTGNSSTRSTISSVLSSSSLSSSNRTTTSNFFSDSFTSSFTSSSTDVAGGGWGGYVAPTSDTTASTAPVSTPTGVSSTSNSPPVSPGLLGGVIGGVAGLAFVLVAILYMVRRRRRENAAQEMDDAGYGGPLEGGGADQVTQRSSISPFALAGSFFARHPRQSHVSQSPEATVPSTEVGFYKVSGRKLPPVIGGPRPGYGSTRSAGGSSKYPDDDGITVASTPSVAGPSRYSSMTAASASPTSLTAPMAFVTSSPAPISSAHPPHIGPSMAPPPPRIPEEASEIDTGSTPNLPRPPLFPRQLSTVSAGSLGKDGVGRSLPSHDGSRASRFTEDV